MKYGNIYSYDNLDGNLGTQIGSYGVEGQYGIIYSYDNLDGSRGTSIASFYVDSYRKKIKFWYNENMDGTPGAISKFKSKLGEGHYWETNIEGYVDRDEEPHGTWVGNEVFDYNGVSLGRFSGPDVYGGVAAFYILSLDN